MFLYTNVMLLGCIYKMCFTGHRKKLIQKRQLKIKRCFAVVLTLIKARMALDPYVKNNCNVLEKQIPFYNNGSAFALFDCLAALDGSATNTKSFIHEPLSS